MEKQEVREIQEEINDLYIQYAETDDKDERRDMRKRWKELVARYEELTGLNHYRKSL